jgi:hypothetical protein
MHRRELLKGGLLAGGVLPMAGPAEAGAIASLHSISRSLPEAEISTSRIFPR